MQVEADLARDAFHVCYDASRVGEMAMAGAVRALGYRVRIIRAGQAPSGSLRQRDGQTLNGADAAPGVLSSVGFGPAPSTRIPEIVADGLREARQSSLRLLLEFHAEWCASCRDLDSVVLPDPRVSAALKGYLSLRIDVDAHPEAGEAMNVRSLPTLIIVDHEGRELARMEGEIEAPALAEVLFRHGPASGDACR